jgi:hypothetical protein
MMLLPFAIAVVVFGLLRRTGRHTHERVSRGHAGIDADHERVGGMRELKP